MFKNASETLNRISFSCFSKIIWVKLWLKGLSSCTFWGLYRSWTTLNCDFFSIHRRCEIRWNQNGGWAVIGLWSGQIRHIQRCTARHKYPFACTGLKNDDGVYMNVYICCHPKTAFMLIVVGRYFHKYRYYFTLYLCCYERKILKIQKQWKSFIIFFEWKLLFKILISVGQKY